TLGHPFKSTASQAASVALHGNYKPWVTSDSDQHGAEYRVRSASPQSPDIARARQHVAFVAAFLPADGWRTSTETSIRSQADDLGYLVVPWIDDNNLLAGHKKFVRLDLRCLLGNVTRYGLQPNVMRYLVADC